MINLSDLFSCCASEYQLPVTLAVVTLVLYGIIDYMRTYSFWSSRGIKGPTPLPYFGNALTYFFRSIAEVDIENHEKYGKVYGVFEGRKPVLIVSDPVVIEKICVTHFREFQKQLEINSPDPLDLNQILGLDGDDWKRVRTAITSGLTGSKLKSMAEVLDTRDMMDYIESNLGSVFNLRHLFSLQVLNGVTQLLYSVNFDLFKNPNHDMVKVAQGILQFNFIKMFWSSRLPSFLVSMIGAGFQSEESTAFIKDFITVAIEQRSHEGKNRNDFLQTILDGKSLNDIQVMANSITMLAAAFDTTSTSLTFFGYEMAKNPDKQRMIQDELDSLLTPDDLEKGLSFEKLSQLVYMDAAITEALRTHPTDVRGFRRVSAVPDAKIPGTDVSIPHNTFIQIPFYALHYDPEIFPDADSFMPERFLPDNKQNIQSCSFMSFGAGPRMCAGMRFANMIMKITLASLMKKYSFVRCKQTVDQIVIPKGMLIADPRPVFVKIVRRE